MGFLDYDVEIRKIICSTNAIESLAGLRPMPESHVRWSAWHRGLRSAGSRWLV
jgi:hypothetical protein